MNGLDFRPVKGVLYGYQKSSGGIYSVDTSTGVTTFVSTPTAPVGSALLGLDFNPVVDRLRLVTANDENRCINTITGATTTDGAFAYAVGDVNFGSNPNLVDAGYTNSDRNVATATQLFYIDYVLDALVGTTSPNGGILNTVGSLGFDTDRFVGFDIFTAANGLNIGSASLRVGGVGGVKGSYTVNLNTGLASLVGQINADQLFALVVAAILEPDSLALVAAAGIAAFGLRRRSTGSGLTPTKN